MDGCIPSSVITRGEAFVVPWRYKNRRTSMISWKIFHLCKDDIVDADSETIVVNPGRDQKLSNALERVEMEGCRYQDAALVEYLLKVVRETLGDYGLEGGPSSTEADQHLLDLMHSQGHNFVQLCHVGIGLCRHKALLFKLLCDVIHLSCALITGYSTAGRHQWNIITLPDKGDFLIDPTSPFFTWTKRGSKRTKAYKVSAHSSFGHGGFTQKRKGIL
ncbi:hypothetical protein SpCBS45565_g07648 [Spizellomyces sp. 'palustris']|nr:hypothetical protein SpCBS45565_g07648 [Spizellomyces sp. 'palustris']